eukprot:6049163-Pleurochrysis_carterae.AAC.2
MRNGEGASGGSTPTRLPGGRLCHKKDGLPPAEWIFSEASLEMPLLCGTGGRVRLIGVRCIGRRVSGCCVVRRNEGGIRNVGRRDVWFGRARSGDGGIGGSVDCRGGRGEHPCEQEV